MLANNNNNNNSEQKESSLNMGVAWFYHAQAQACPGSDTSVNSTNTPSVITGDNNNQQPTNLKLQVNCYQNNF